ncbi:hypothetical protein TomMM35A_08500 [Sphingobium sp. TomMM35A]
MKEIFRRFGWAKNKGVQVEADLAAAHLHGEGGAADENLIVQAKVMARIKRDGNECDNGMGW